MRGNNFIPLKLEFRAFQFVFRLFHRRIVFGARECLPPPVSGRPARQGFRRCFSYPDSPLSAPADRIRRGRHLFSHGWPAGTSLVMTMEPTCALRAWGPGPRRNARPASFHSGGLPARILPFHFYCGLTSVRSSPALPEVREEIRGSLREAERRLLPA